jgi:hypothetical protein
MATSDRLKGFNYVGQLTLTPTLKDNLVTLLDWGLTDRGGFWNAERNTLTASGAYGGDWTQLRPVSSPYYVDGQVWESKRQNWVWETGLNEGNAISISGVYVDNTFIPNGSGFHINYPLGQVIFAEPRLTSATVNVNHSYKWIKVVDSRDIPFLRGVETESFRIDDVHFLMGSGSNMKMAETRLQLPLVGVEVLANRKYAPHAIGGSRYAYTDVIYHVVAEDDNAVGHLIDIIGGQDEKTFFMFSPQRLADNGVSPLDWRGSISSGNLTYPNLVAPTGDGGYRYTDGVHGGTVRFFDSRGANGDWISSDMYAGTVRMTTEVILPVGR